MGGRRWGETWCQYRSISCSIYLLPLVSFLLFLGAAEHRIPSPGSRVPTVIEPLT